MIGLVLDDNISFILEKLVSNKKLYELIYPYAEPFTEDLIHQNILTIPVIPKDRKGSFIVVNLIDYIPKNDGYGELTLRIDVLCGYDKSDWYHNGRMRAMEIVEEIIKSLQNIRISGIGSLNLEVIEKIDSANENYGGFCLGYYSSAFDES